MPDPDAQWPGGRHRGELHWPKQPAHYGHQGQRHSPGADDPLPGSEDQQRGGRLRSLRLQRREISLWPGLPPHRPGSRGPAPEPLCRAAEGLLRGGGPVRPGGDFQRVGQAGEYFPVRLRVHYAAAGRESGAGCHHCRPGYSGPGGHPGSKGPGHRNARADQGHESDRSPPGRDAANLYDLPGNACKANG